MKIELHRNSKKEFFDIWIAGIFVDTEQSTPEEIVLRINLEHEEAENFKNHYSALSNTNWFVYYCDPNPQRKMETKK
ncbi:hypothetical protein TNCV_2969081 [Trichonephila clavipes]|nr:hypothetical protein TNCV_2969081 [Trichonephila clavipes]